MSHTPSAPLLQLRSTRFTPLAFLGRGANGLVYRVRDEEMGVEVALKTLPVRAPEELYRLKREFRVLKDILHPNLVELYDLVVDEWECFFTMELIDGVTFIDYVRPAAGPGDAAPDGGAAHDRFLGAAAQLATGLEVLHADGKLHRDIKPSNILVSRTGRVVLLDFGLAVGTEPDGARDTLSAIVGTFAYMSPEAAWGQRVTPAADWYSVGVLFYEAVTGRLPFTGPPAKVLADKARATPPAPRAVTPGVPAAIDALVTALLDPEPGRRPTGGEVLARLRETATVGTPAGTGAAQWALATSADAPFVGRDGELGALGAALAAVGCREARIVEVEGVSGMGKSELVRRFLATVEVDPDAVVLAGRCHPQESVPYKALDTVVDRLSRVLMTHDPAAVAALVPRHAGALVRLFPVLARVPALAEWSGREEAGEPYEVRRRGFAALRELLARLGDRHRLVLWIDDLQWADTDSAVLLRELVRPPDPPLMLLILSYRTGEEHVDFTQAVRRAEADLPDRSLTRIRLGPLRACDTRTLVRRLAADPLEPQVAAISDECQGSPFLATQLARYLRTNPGLRSGSPGLATFVQDRAAQMPSPTRAVLELACIAARPIDRRILLTAAGIGERGRPLVTRLEREGLLRLTPRAGAAAVEAYHDRIRELIVHGLAADARRERHRQLAVTLEQEPAPDPEGLFRHYLGAGERSRAAGWAVRAAERAAAALAFHDAASLYGQALDLETWDESRTAHLQEQRADALVNAGRGGEAAPLYVAAARGRPPLEGLDLRRRAAEQFLVTGRIDAGIAELRALLHRLRLPYPASTGRTLLGLVSHLAQLSVRGLRFRRQDACQVQPAMLLRVDACNAAAKGLVQVDPLRGTYYSLMALLLALRAGEVWRIGRDLCLGSSGLIVAGGPFAPWGHRMLAEARRIAEETGDRHLLGITAITTGVVTILEGRWDDVRRLCDEGGQILTDHCRGVTWERDIGRMAAIRAQEERGAVHDLLHRVSEFQREAAELGDTYAEITARQYRAFWRLADDDPADARAQSRAALAMWTHSAYHLQHFYGLRLEAYCDLYEGRPEAAWTRLQEAWPMVCRSNLLRHPVVRVDADILQGRVALAMAASGGGTRAALRRATQAARALARSARPDARAHAHLLDAGAAALLGERVRARQVLETAAAAFDNAGVTLGAVYARHRLGELRGDADGRRLRTAADHSLRERTINNPDRWLTVHAPGFVSGTR